MEAVFAGRLVFARGFEQRGPDGRAEVPDVSGATGVSSGVAVAVGAVGCPQEFLVRSSTSSAMSLTSSAAVVFEASS